ncbi:class I SAM-dependent methyltransferase [Streptomyces sp. HNM0575]|uniref:class I SAM-dependent methyltransferase n=1 Tax=Streptomyces sp. HNM0575 TaxID=2716338 RepID=UPI00145F699E|nr:class I SAM-dependent methyltransferase [Streptomyces sp. HNM0575]NLU76719.1 class I SAM-dependent methyltransferase [Streptomyces sp. HNM0575]
MTSPSTPTASTTRATAAEADGNAAADEESRETPLPRPRSFREVRGWFYNTDIVLFDWLLSRQRRLEQRGDLLEMGAYLGKSAIMLRSYLRDEETFTVCDLFGSEAPTESNEREMRGSYSTLTRRGFEANYLSFHDELPRVLHAPTSVVPGEVAPDSCRFVHIDASHLYEHVRPDIAAARGTLTRDGIVVLDDYRSSHTPGVACATWQAVLEDGLRPVCVSAQKFYGTWGDPSAVQQELYAALRERGDCWLQWQDVAGHRLLLVGADKAAPPELPHSRHAKSRAAARDSDGDGGGRRSRGAALSALSRRAAREVLPPVISRHLARALRGDRGR